jgi:hypothetical protein
VASFISPIGDQRMVGSLSRHSVPRNSVRAARPVARRETLLLGTTSFCGDGIYDVAGKFAGEIEDLILDLYSGRVAYALVAVGGFLGIGQKMFAIPWSAFTVDRAYRRCIICVDRQQLLGAPTFEDDIPRQMADAQWATEVHAYFGCKPYWE